MMLRLSTVDELVSFALIVVLTAPVACRPIVDLAPDGESRRIVVVVEDGRAVIARDRQVEVAPGGLVAQWYLSSEDFLWADGARVSPQDLATKVSIRLDDEAPAPGFGECGRCAAPTRSAPYVISPGDSCPLPPTAMAELRLIAKDGANLVDPAALSDEEQADLRDLASRLRLDWTGPCLCPAGEPFEPVPSFKLTPVAPASSRHGFWASAVRNDGTVVALSTAYLHVFDRSGVEHRSPSPFDAFSIDAIVPLPDGRFVVWGVDDTKSISVSTRPFFVDIAEPSAPLVQAANVLDWPLSASFRFQRWQPRPDGAVRLIGFAIEPFRGNVDEPMVVDCIPESTTLRCTRFEGRLCRESDIALMTADTPEESLIITRRMIQATDRCVDLNRAIESVRHPSGRTLTEFRDIRKGTQNGDWVYLCARFNAAAVVFATTVSALERPSQWTVLPIGASCREDEDFIEIDGTTYYAVADRAYRIRQGTTVDQVELAQIYGADAPSRVGSYQHTRAGDWTLAGLGFDQLVLQRRSRGGAWQRLSGPEGAFPPTEMPFDVIGDDLIGLPSSDVDAALIPGRLRVLPPNGPVIETLYAVGDRVFVGRPQSDGSLQIDILDREFSAVRSFSLPVGVQLVRPARITDEINILGTTAGLWTESVDGVARVAVPGESESGWRWQARAGLGGVWGLADQKLHLVRPTLSGDRLGVIANRYGPDEVQAYDAVCPAQLVFLRGDLNSWVPADTTDADASLDRVLTMRNDPTLVTEASFNPDLRGRPIDLLRRGRRAVIATDWNLLVSAGAEVVGRAPFRIRKIHADRRGYVYVEGFQGRLAVSDRPVLP